MAAYACAGRLLKACGDQELLRVEHKPEEHPQLVSVDGMRPGPALRASWLPSRSHVPKPVA